MLASGHLTMKESNEENPVKSAEFQAIILAGEEEGNRLYPIGDDIPKPLLPVANVPLICYQLKLLERAGFTGKLRDPSGQSMRL